MTNDFLEAINNDSDEEETSSDRYEKLKKEEAGTQDQSKAEQRFEKLKEEAKQEFVEKQKKRDDEPEEQDEDEDSDVFITH